MHLDLTVITISKDDPSGLERTLQSLSTQTQKPAKVIVVRAGRSTSLDLKFFEATTITDINCSGSGISSAFNKGLSESNNSWVMFLNGGDELKQKNTLRNIFSLIDVNPNGLDIISGFAESEDGRRVPGRRPTKARNFLLLSHQASVFKRELFYKIGEYSTNLRVRMDLDWMCRYISTFGSSSIFFMNEALVRYEFNGISSIEKKLFYQEEIAILWKYKRLRLLILKTLFFDIPKRFMIPRQVHSFLIKKFIANE